MIVGNPTVQVTLQLSGRLITTPQELERLLEDVRRQILHQLEANHGVRLW